MNRALNTILLLSTLLLVVPSAAALAQTAGKPPAARVNVYQYAVDNPVEDSVMKMALSIGASVPQAVTLTPCADEKTYSYFYYNGQPVIVDQKTRSVVRIGQ